MKYYTWLGLYYILSSLKILTCGLIYEFLKYLRCLFITHKGAKDQICKTFFSLFVQREYIAILNLEFLY